MDPTAAATLFAWLDRELWLVTAQSGSQRGGLIATFVSQASITSEFPRVLVALAKQHFTAELVESSGAFALHLLGEDNLDLVWQFGLESGRGKDKFADLSTTTGRTGSPLLDQTVGWLDCRAETKLDIGDRMVYVAEVVEGQVHNYAPPLRVGRLRELAPTSRLSQMQRILHLDSYLDTEAIRVWRERQGQ